MADPIVATALGVLAAVTFVGVMIPGAVFPHDQDARSHVLDIAGGILLLGGAYYTALGIREVRSQQYLARLTAVVGQLASESTTVRIGAIRQLQGYALEQPILPVDSITPAAVWARKRAVLDVLRAASSEPNIEVASLATRVIEELSVAGFRVSDTL